MKNKVCTITNNIKLIKGTSKLVIKIVDKDGNWYDGYVNDVNKFVDKILSSGDLATPESKKGE